MARCNGPGNKIIYDTKQEALADLRTPRPGRRAREGNGMIMRCMWGEHYHITSHKKPRRKR